MASPFDRFEQDRVLRLLVVSLAENPNFNDQLVLFKNIRSLQLMECNHPSSWNTRNSAFKYLRWNSGEALFDFVTADRSQPPRKTDRYFASKRIVGVLGLLDYSSIAHSADGDKSSKDVSLRILAELTSLKREYNDCLITRICVFNFPFESHASIDSGLDMSVFPSNLLEIFPPLSFEHIHHAHCLEIMGNITVELLLALDVQMKAAEAASDALPISSSSNPLEWISPKKTSPSDSTPPLSGSGGRKKRFSLSAFTGDASSKGSHSGRTSPVKPKTAKASQTEELLRFHTVIPVPGAPSTGRYATLLRQCMLYKWMGDMSMQSCSPLDALEWYIQGFLAFRSFSSQTDTEDAPLLLESWMLGGIASSVLLCLANGVPEESIQAMLATMEEEAKDSAFISPSKKRKDSAIDILAVVEKTLEGLIQMFNKRPNLGEPKVDSLMRFADFMVMKCMREDAPSEQSDECRTRIAKCVTRAYIVASHNSLISAETLEESARMCDCVGMRRKAAFFALLARNTYRESDPTASLQASVALVDRFCGKEAVYMWSGLRFPLIASTCSLIVSSAQSKTASAILQHKSRECLRLLGLHLEILCAFHERQFSVGDVNMLYSVDKDGDNMSLASDSNTSTTPAESTLTEHRLRLLNASHADDSSSVGRLDSLEISTDPGVVVQPTVLRAGSKSSSHLGDYASRLHLKSILSSFSRTGSVAPDAHRDSLRRVHISAARLRRAWPTSSFNLPSEAHQTAWKMLQSFIDCISQDSILNTQETTQCSMPFRVSCIVPQMLPVNERPMLRPSDSSDPLEEVPRMSSLFYDPFHKHSAKAVVKDVPLWTVGSLCCMHIELVSRIECSVRLFDVQAVCDGPEHICYPVTCSLSPASEKQPPLSSSIKVLGPGTLVFRGISFRVTAQSKTRFFLNYGGPQLSVDDHIAPPVEFRSISLKSGVKQKPESALAITVLPASATLTARWTGMGKPLDLLPGETRSESFFFENITPNMEVVEFTVFVLAKFAGAKPKRILLLKGFKNVLISAPAYCSFVSFALLDNAGASIDSPTSIPYESTLQIDLAIKYVENLLQLDLVLEYANPTSGDASSAHYFKSVSVQLPINHSPNSIAVKSVTCLSESPLLRSTSIGMRLHSDSVFLDNLGEYLRTVLEQGTSISIRPPWNLSVFRVENNTDLSVYFRKSEDELRNVGTIDKAASGCFCLESSEVVPPKSCRNFIVSRDAISVVHWKMAAPSIATRSGYILMEPKVATISVLISLGDATEKSHSYSHLCATEEYVSLQIQLESVSDCDVDIVVFALRVDVAESGGALLDGQRRKKYLLRACEPVVHCLHVLCITDGVFAVGALVRAQGDSVWSLGARPAILTATAA